MTDRSLDRAGIVAIDKRAIWHPYTPMRAYIEETDPLVVVRAEGARLFDADGRSYLDASSSWWAAGLGHAHPRLVAALTDQARTLAHVAFAGITHEPAALLAEALLRRAPPGLTRVFYSDDGSTALEAALKMVVGYHERTSRSSKRRFVSLRGAFHGETLGVTALGGVELFRESFAGMLMDVWFVPAPEADEPASGPAFTALERLFSEHGDEIAGMVVEPIVQGAAGMRMYPGAFLKRARALCDLHGALLIADEVFTGYGRTGTFWAVEHAAVTPDLLCTAKTFSGGMLPMAATLASGRVFDAFLDPPDRALYYGHSYCGNPLGARVALEVLRVFDEEHLLEGIDQRARLIEAAFARIGALEGTSRARSLGMIGAVDLGKGGSYLGKAGWRAFEEARRLGAYLRPLGDVVYVTPPINIPIADLEELLAIVEASVRVALGV